MGICESVKGSCKKAQVLSKVTFIFSLKIELSVFMLSSLSWLVLGRKVGRLLGGLWKAGLCEQAGEPLPNETTNDCALFLHVFAVFALPPINQVFGQDKPWWALLSTLLMANTNTQSRFVIFNGLFESPGNGHVAMVYFKHLGLGSCCSNHLNSVTT